MSTNQVELPDVPEVMAWLDRYMKDNEVQITVTAVERKVRDGMLRVSLNTNAEEVMQCLLTKFCMGLKSGNINRRRPKCGNGK